MIEGRPRYTQRSLPPYSYVPGHTPHPVSDPAGHMHGQTHEPPKPLQPGVWRESEEYLFGIDLFNHGFYWESHEAWESLWHEAGRGGVVADFLKGLIKLAAAAVKAREGKPRGVNRHSSRAKELLSSADQPVFCGLELNSVIVAVDAMRESADLYHRPQPQLALDIVLLPKDT